METPVVDSVLLSYALVDLDRPHVKALWAKLQSMGVVGPTDQLIDHVKIIMDSHASRDAIKRQIAHVSKVIVFWTDRSAESEWINYERGMADALGKEILVVVPPGQKAPLPDYISENAIIELPT